MPPKKFLIVDDEQGIVDEIKSFFTEEGFEVFIADTAKDGIDLVKAIKPDILFLDMKLPDASGIIVLQASKEYSPFTKVIVSTGYVDQHLIDEAERLGRDAFLPKPFNLLMLKDEVDKLFSSI